MGMALYDPALAAQKALLRPLASSGRVTWFGYLSSTGVYGDWQGEWVDESSACRQTSSKAIVRQEAEAAWMAMHAQHGLPTHLFRLGGIYGPGRSVVEALAAEAASLSASQQRRGRQRYTARCHVYDIAAVLAASMAAPAGGSVYNVVDDDPAPRGDVMAFARELLRAGGDGPGGAAAPGSGSGPTDASITEAPAAPATAAESDGSGSEQAASSGPSRRGGAGGREGGALEEKRVRNGRIKEALRVSLRHPSYREGVAALVAGDTWPLSAADLALL